MTCFDSNIVRLVVIHNSWTATIRTTVSEGAGNMSSNHGDDR
jgi:hypothetical protein